MRVAKRRRGISGLMQVAMIVGIVIIFSGLMFTFASDIFSVQTISDSLSLQKVFVQSVGQETYVSVNAKNTGNTDISSMEALVMVDTDSSATGVQPFKLDIDPSPLRPGITGSAYAKIVDSSNANIVMSTGAEVIVVLNATTADGSAIVNPVTVRVQ